MYIRRSNQSHKTRGFLSRDTASIHLREADRDEHGSGKASPVSSNTQYKQTIAKQIQKMKHMHKWVPSVTPFPNLHLEYT